MFQSRAVPTNTGGIPNKTKQNPPQQNKGNKKAAGDNEYSSRERLRKEERIRFDRMKRGKRGEFANVSNIQVGERRKMVRSFV